MKEIEITEKMVNDGITCNDAQPCSGCSNEASRDHCKCVSIFAAALKAERAKASIWKDATPIASHVHAYFFDSDMKKIALACYFRELPNSKELEIAVELAKKLGIETTRSNINIIESAIIEAKAKK